MPYPQQLAGFLKDSRTPVNNYQRNYFLFNLLKLDDFEGEVGSDPGGGGWGGALRHTNTYGQSGDKDDDINLTSCSMVGRGVRKMVAVLHVPKVMEKPQWTQPRMGPLVT